MKVSFLAKTEIILGANVFLAHGCIFFVAMERTLLSLTDREYIKVVLTSQLNVDSSLLSLVFPHF